MTASDLPRFFDRKMQEFSATGGSVAVAVSGGSDSMALALLAKGWAEKHGIELHALTVDHGLRETSATEARTVGNWLRRQGLRYQILTWAGPHPTTGIQKSAREARYRLMADYCADHGIGVLLLGHQMEDQLETVLMRLSKGSGLEGLTGMQSSSYRGALRLLRPLLDVRRQTLKDFLTQRKQDWISDPSNENPVFTRTRVGAVLEELRQLPESSVEAISLAVTRLSRASHALDQLAAEKIREICHISPFGFARFDAAALDDCPEELALRILTTLFTGVGGGGQRIKLQALENLHGRLFGDAGGRSGTLGGCQIARCGDNWLISREPGRTGLPELDVRTDGAPMLWDGRFEVTDTAPGSSLPKEPLMVRALGAEGWQILKELDLTRAEKELPAKVRNALPALWSGDRLLAAPLFSREIPQSFIAKGRFEMVFKSLIL